MLNDEYGVIALKLEFWLSVILFVGVFALIWQDKSLMTPCFTILGVVITFWFSRRATDTSQSNLISSMQQQPISQLPQIPQIPQEPQIKIVEQPAEPRAPQYMQPTGETKNV